MHFKADRLLYKVKGYAVGYIHDDVNTFKVIENICNKWKGLGFISGLA